MIPRQTYEQLLPDAGVCLLPHTTPHTTYTHTDTHSVFSVEAVSNWWSVERKVRGSKGIETHRAVVGVRNVKPECEYCTVLSHVCMYGQRKITGQPQEVRCTVSGRRRGKEEAVRGPADVSGETSRLAERKHTLHAQLDTSVSVCRHACAQRVTGRDGTGHRTRSSRWKL